jgi:hypothetical protein
MPIVDQGDGRRDAFASLKIDQKSLAVGGDGVLLREQAGQRAAGNANREQGCMRHFIAKYAADNDLCINGITPGASAILQQYAWVGNVRELENIIGQAMEHCSGDVIKVEDLPDEVFPAGQDRHTCTILSMEQYVYQQSASMRSLSTFMLPARIMNTPLFCSISIRAASMPSCSASD